MRETTKIPRLRIQVGVFYATSVAIDSAEVLQGAFMSEMFGNNQ
jgi:hypothetical protein